MKSIIAYVIMTACIALTGTLAYKNVQHRTTIATQEKVIVEQHAMTLLTE